MNILNGLTFTPFEWAMTNEFNGSLMEFVVRLSCTGSIDIEIFSQAINEGIKRQPFLQANASIGPTYDTSYWRPASDHIPMIRWFDGAPKSGRGSTDGFKPIELKKEIGFRFYGWQFFQESELQTEMRFVFHHACCDGKGAISFIEHVLCQYKQIKDGSGDASMLALDYDHIFDRDQLPSQAGGIVGKLFRTFIVRPQRLAKMLLSRPLSLPSSPDADAKGFVDPPRQCSLTFDLKTTEKLGIYSNSVGATTNLVLTRELFHVLDHHLQRQQVASGEPRRGKHLRILIPFSLRNKTNQRMPAANCVSMAYLEAKRNLLLHDRAEYSGLLADLVKQLAYIRRWQLQYSLVELIRSHARLWPVIRLLKRSQQKKDNKRSSRPVATSVLSNLGRVFCSEGLATYDSRIKIDSLTVNTVHLVLPCSASLNINFSVNFYGNRLTLDASYLPSLVTQEKAQSLLNSWQRRILAVVNSRAD